MNRNNITAYESIVNGILIYKKSGPIKKRTAFLHYYENLFSCKIQLIIVVSLIERHIPSPFVGTVGWDCLCHR